MFFIAGITGRVGGAAARELLKLGKQVRALARDPKKAEEWTKQGVDVRQGDFTDAAAIASALEGVEGAYLMMYPIMSPAPGFPETKAVIAAYQQALQQTPVPRLVMLSSIGSEQPKDLGLITSTALMEQAFNDLPFPTAFVRAGSFIENFAPLLQTAAASGVFYTFYQPVDRPVPMIGTEDIGKEVAHLLLGSWTGKKIVELGTEATANQVADAMGEVLTRDVTAQAVPRERWAVTLQSFGFQPGATGPYEQMVDSINSGWIHFGVPGTERVPANLTAADVFRQVNKP